MGDALQVAIVGAGPYGLSIAAHAQSLGVTVRVFGKPLSTWAQSMPEGMLLKSDGFASNLSTSDGQGSLAEYCAANGIKYSDTFDRVSLQTFVNYGFDFQKRFVPNLDRRDVISIDHSGDRFRLELDDHETAIADRVVLAVGITHFSRMPDILSPLRGDVVTHSSEHRKVDQFAGRDVAILGGGSSAVELAALLQEAGARTVLVTRRESVRFTTMPQIGERTLWERWRRPSSPLGPGWFSRISSDMPGSFRFLPPRLRLYLVRRSLGPISAWHMEDRVLGKIEVLAQHQLQSASVCSGRAQLKLLNSAGQARDLCVDHVIAATGYWPDVKRLKFLSPEIRASIRETSGVPVLSRDFETSVPGIYMSGLASAGTFGPMMRFVAGADYTARRISQHLVRKRPAGRVNSETGYSRVQ